MVKRFRELRPKYAAEYPFKLNDFWKMSPEEIFPENETDFKFGPDDSFCPSFTYSAVSQCFGDKEFDILYGSPEKISDFLGRSLAVSIATGREKPVLPVKQILTHGTVLSKEGVAFEDREFNTISGYRPTQLQYRAGMDIFRLWALTSADEREQKMDPSFKEIEKVYKDCRKFTKFMLDTIVDFDPRNWFLTCASI